MYFNTVNLLAVNSMYVLTGMYTMLVSTVQATAYNVILTVRTIQYFTSTLLYCIVCVITTVAICCSCSCSFHLQSELMGSAAVEGRGSGQNVSALV